MFNCYPDQMRHTLNILSLGIIVNVKQSAHIGWTLLMSVAG